MKMLLSKISRDTARLRAHGFSAMAGSPAECLAFKHAATIATRAKPALDTQFSTFRKRISLFSTSSTDSDVEALADAPHESGELAPLTKDTPFKRAFGAKGCEPQLRDLLNAMLCSGADTDLAVAEILNVESRDTLVRSVIFVSTRALSSLSSHQSGGF